MKNFLLATLIVAGFTGTVSGQTIDLTSADFSKADSVASLYADHPLNDLHDLSMKLTGPLPTDLQKFRSIYKWVCSNIAYDYRLYAESKRKRERLRDEELSKWNKKFARQVFKVLLTKKVTVCTGYAYLVKELSLHAGISCTVIDGYGRNSLANIGGTGVANHSWNAVLINGEWYLCDPTWSSGGIDTRLSMFVREFNDAYFLAAPELFVRSHYPLDSSWMLLPIKPSLETFLDGPLAYAAATRHQVQPLLPKTFSITTSKGSSVSFQLSGKSDGPPRHVKLLIQGTSAKDTASSVTSDEAILYSIDHTFSSRGVFAVHLLVDGIYAFTYQVTVK